MSIHTIKKGTLEYLAAEGISAPHAFTTRLGGVSRDHLFGLNLAMHKGDLDTNVEENYRILTAALGVETEKLVLTRQVHGDVIRVVTQADCRGVDHHAYPECDGLLTNTWGVSLVVFTADCTPILMEARAGDRVLAVAAVHAGWKGSVGDITGIGVQMLREAAEARADGEHVRIYAAIGPCIHACCFTVQSDCISVVREKLGNFAEPFIRATGEGFTLDLPALNRALLLRAGVEEMCIDVCPDCTACRTDLYYSHRAQHGVRGTMLSVIKNA